MTKHLTDPLLTAGRLIALVLQGMCAVAGGVFFLLAPLVILISQGILPGFSDPNDLPDVARFPLLTTGICLTITANFAAMFVFFGKMRALIESAIESDPFIPENAQRLNAMAWLLLGSQVLTVITGELRVFAFSLIDPQSKSTLDISPADLAGFLIVLILFILARVFQHGAAMREDLEATV